MSAFSGKKPPLCEKTTNMLFTTNDKFQKSFYHLRDITLSDTDTKKEFTVHIKGAGDYTKIKTQERARIGLPGQPVAELTKL